MIDFGEWCEINAVEIDSNDRLGGSFWNQNFIKAIKSDYRPEIKRNHRRFR
jgi:plasmid rolling circle replication initiator protein Rep